MDIQAQSPESKGVGWHGKPTKWARDNREEMGTGMNRETPVSEGKKNHGDGKRAQERRERKKHKRMRKHAQGDIVFPNPNCHLEWGALTATSPQSHGKMVLLPSKLPSTLTSK